MISAEKHNLISAHRQLLGIPALRGMRSSKLRDAACPSDQLHGGLTLRRSMGPTAEQAQVIQERAAAWLTGDGRAINSVAHTLMALEPDCVSIDLHLLRSGEPSPARHKRVNPTSL